MFGRIGMGELLLILGIVLIVFGPAKSCPLWPRAWARLWPNSVRVQEKSQRNGTRWKAKPSLRLKRQKLRKKLPTDQRSCEQEALA